MPQDPLDQPGAHIFQPKAWNLRFYGAEYLHEEAVRARLEFRGIMPADKVVRVLPEHGVATELRERGPLAIPGKESDLVDRVLRAFDRHNWGRLSMPDNRWAESYKQHPIAFVGPDGKVATPADVSTRLARLDVGAARHYLAGCHLVARLDGPWRERVHVQIAVPVLLQGDTLGMLRVRDRIAWRREQVWLGQLSQSPESTVAMASLPRVNLPLENPTFAFVYGQEISQDMFLVDLFRSVLTPAAMVLDAAILNNIWVLNAIQALKKSTWSGPFTGGRK